MLIFLEFLLMIQQDAFLCKKVYIFPCCIHTQHLYKHCGCVLVIRKKESASSSLLALDAIAHHSLPIKA